MSPCHARRAAERFELRLEGARGSLAQARRRLEPLWLIELDHRRAVVVLTPRARGIGVAPPLVLPLLEPFLLARRPRALLREHLLRCLSPVHNVVIVV